MLSIQLVISIVICIIIAVKTVQTYKHYMSTAHENTQYFVQKVARLECN